MGKQKSKPADKQVKEHLPQRRTRLSATNDSQFFAEIAELLKAARGHAYRAVNSVMVETYWHIGRRIVEQEQKGKNRADYGDKLIEGLSRYLTDIFGKGFSGANLRNMRQFYVNFPEFARQCLANLSWTNICIIMRISDKKERDYYLQEASEQNWSSRVLERNIRSGYYRRLLSTQGTGKVRKPKVPAVLDSADFIKDPYVLEFLDVPEDLTGKETILEKALIDNLQKFLLELGKGFAFVSRQQRISTETDHFYVDLVFYNILLKCYVVIDLKTTKLSPEHVGQMDMYVRMFDALRRGEDDNPTIGIIFCTEKNETVVKFSILNESKQIFASKYKTILPTEDELADMITKENRRLLTDEATTKKGKKK